VNNPATLSTEDPAPPQTGFVSVVRRIGPWLVGIAILVVVATRIPFDAFRSAVGRGPHLLLAAVDLAVTALILCSDAVSTWFGLIALRMRRPLREVIAVRGATYLLFLLNYALGQGGFGYYLHRSGIAPLRAVGATLFLIGTNLATLLLVTTVAWGVHGAAADPKLWLVLQIGCAAFAAYLVVIAVAPRSLADRGVLAPLFDARIAGHAVAMVGRLPHVAAMVIGIWLAMRAWGIAVPFDVGLAVMPLVVIASVLPISPAGLGTTQAALVYFFQDYAVGATADDRAAAVLAFAIVHFVYAVLAQLLVGLVCAPFARRIRAPDLGRAAA
jgi:hypothetical protein